MNVIVGKAQIIFLYSGLPPEDGLQETIFWSAEGLDSQSSKR